MFYLALAPHCSGDGLAAAEIVDLSNAKEGAFKPKHAELVEALKECCGFKEGDPEPGAVGYYLRRVKGRVSGARKLVSDSDATRKVARWAVRGASGEKLGAVS